MTDRPLIGLLDSGIGGLPLARRLHDALPGADFLYYADTAAGPAGAKGRDAILRSAAKGLRFLAGRTPVLTVVTCHTLSAVAVGGDAGVGDTPVLDILRASARAAAKASKAGRIGVLGSEALVASEAYPRAVAGLRPSAVVWSRSCPLIEALVEEGRLGRPETAMIVKKYLAPLRQRRIDALVAATGHGMAIEGLLRRKAGRRVLLVDPTPELLRRIEAGLGEGGRRRVSGTGGGIRCVVSDLPPWLAPAAARLFGARIPIEERPG